MFTAVGSYDRRRKHLKGILSHKVQFREFLFNLENDKFPCVDQYGRSNLCPINENHEIFYIFTLKVYKHLVFS